MTHKSVKITIAALILCLSSPSLYAKESIWDLTLTDGETVNGVSLRRIESEWLVVSSFEFTKGIAVDSIHSLRSVKKSNFWKGAGIGFLVGIAGGVLLGLASYEAPDPTEESIIVIDFGPGVNAIAGAFVGAPVGFVAGGIIGAASGKDKTYDLSAMSHEKKMETIHAILAKR